MSKLQDETMNFARRVATFDIDEVVVEDDDGVNFEREYLMGGVQKSDSSSNMNVALLGDHEAKKDITGLRTILFSSLLTIAMGGFIGFSCVREVNHAHHYFLCVLGMGIAFSTIVSGVVSWIGIWRARKKEMNPITLAHSLAVISLYGYISYVCILYYLWKDRIILGNIPMDGVNRQFLSLLSIGAIALLMIFVMVTLSLKWKTGTVFRGTHYFNALVLLGVGVLLVLLGLQTIKKHPQLTLWPVCWSIYSSIAAGGVLTLSSIYAFFVKSRPRLTNFLVLLILNLILASSSYFNYFSAKRSDGSRYQELYMSAIIGIASQIVMAFAFITGFLWRGMLTA